LRYGISEFETGEKTSRETIARTRRVDWIDRECGSVHYLVSAKYDASPASQLQNNCPGAMRLQESSHRSRVTFTREHPPLIFICEQQVDVLYTWLEHSHPLSESVPSRIKASPQAGRSGTLENCSGVGPQAGEVEWICHVVVRKTGCYMRHKIDGFDKRFAACAGTVQKGPGASALNQCDGGCRRLRTPVHEADVNVNTGQDAQQFRSE
jgi:hypothetical protein